MNSEPEVKECVQAEEDQTESSIEGIESEECMVAVETVEEIANSEETVNVKVDVNTELIATPEVIAGTEEAEVSVEMQQEEVASAQANTEAEVETSEASTAHESQDKAIVKEKMQAFGQRISVSQVVALMIFILLLLIGSSFMIEAFRPVCEPETEPEPEVTEEVEEPRVILLSSVSPDYIPIISQVYGEVSAHTDYDTMLSDLQCWVKEFGRINIREESNTDSRVIGYVVYGQQISMYGTDGEFTKIKYIDRQTGESVYGYCYSAFLSKEKPSSAKVYLNVPLYKQADSRWGSKMIGGYETLASAGCTTTCISMVESYVHGKNIYPNMMADQLSYTYDGLLTFPGRYSRYAGKDYLQVILNFLHSGMPVLVSGYTSDGRTHWVVVVGYNGDGIDMNPVDFVINDPGGNRSTLADFFRSYPLFEKIVYYTG